MLLTILNLEKSERVEITSQVTISKVKAELINYIHQKNKTWVCFWKSRHKVFELFWNERSVVARDIQTAICNSFFVIYNEKIKITKKNDKSIFSKKKCFKKNLNNLKIYMLTQCFESTFTLIMMYYLGDILKKLFILWRSFFFLKPKCLLFKTAFFLLEIFVDT